MEPFGIFYLATVSAFFPEMRVIPKWAAAGNVGADDVITQYAKGLADDSRVVGYYTCDECASRETAADVPSIQPDQKIRPRQHRVRGGKFP